MREHGKINKKKGGGLTEREVVNPVCRTRGDDNRYSIYTMKDGSYACLMQPATAIAEVSVQAERGIMS